MCYSSPPVYSRPAVSKPLANANAEETFEKIIRKVVTSDEVINRIADRVSERVSERMVPKTQINTAMVRHQTNGILSTAGSAFSHIQYQPITQEEISSVMAALPGVTWRRCHKGHLYAVGECGNPVVSSRCLECKERINH
ncbi:hypothetical protein H4R20_003613 [Coemansia guatemalensis]|uniref:RZ-type domain-containing protein n=1 Tax=Coemansia guatemalensis TaxID=2761395 RepID=A0A9W8LSU8_9FUNG|nr:hypothetical protein H4R20_003613 [Coemansia guatemalensis]